MEGNQARNPRHNAVIRVWLRAKTDIPVGNSPEVNP